MIIIALLIFVSLGIAIIFLAVFYWNVRSGQYDDLYTPSVRILFGDKKPSSAKKKDKPSD